MTITVRQRQCHFICHIGISTIIDLFCCSTKICLKNYYYIDFNELIFNGDVIKIQLFYRLLPTKYQSNENSIIIIGSSSFPYVFSNFVLYIKQN